MAAAIALNNVTSTASASSPSNATIKAGGVLGLASSNDVDVTAVGNGGSVDAANGGDSGNGTNKFQVGVGVAINVVNITNTANIGSGDAITAGGLALSATTTNSSSTKDAPGVGSPDGTSSFVATALSGAGDAGKVGVAGSLALNLVTGNSSQAAILSGASVTLVGRRPT